MDENHLSAALIIQHPFADVTIVLFYCTQEQREEKI